MQSYVLWCPEPNFTPSWLTVATEAQLPPLEEGRCWLPVPEPASDWTAEADPDGQPRVVRYAADPDVAMVGARLVRWAAAKAHRDARAAGGCATPLGSVDTDADSRLKISGAVQMALLAQMSGAPFAPIAWTMSDNTVVAHDAPAMIAMGVAVGRFVDACQQAGTTIREQIEAATDQAALAAIDITAGYPA